jgi:hypothetical protein
VFQRLLAGWPIAIVGSGRFGLWVTEPQISASDSWLAGRRRTGVFWCRRHFSDALLTGAGNIFLFGGNTVGIVAPNETAAKESYASISKQYIFKVPI